MASRSLLSKLSESGAPELATSSDLSASTSLSDSEEEKKKKRMARFGADLAIIEEEKRARQHEIRLGRAMVDGR